MPLDSTQKAEQSRVTRLFTFEGLDRVEVPQASAGEIVALAGLEGVEIGLTVTDLEHPERLAGISVEEPTISVDFLVNNSPFAGKDGKFVTSRQLRERLCNGQLVTALSAPEVVMESCRRHYKPCRPHSSLGYRPPAPEAILPPARGLPYATLRSAHGLADPGRTLT